MNKYLKTAIKVGVVALLLWVLAKQGLLSMDRTRRAFQDWPRILISFMIMVVLSLFGVLRWHWLLQAQGIQISFKRTFQLAYVGNFFNTALPGAVSGDLIKAWYVAKEIKGKKAFALGSILFDRIVGLSALVFVSAGALFFGYSKFHGTSLFVSVFIFVKFTALAVFAFYVYLFLVHENNDPLLKVMKTVQSKIKKFESVTRIYESVRSFHHCRGTVLKALAVSVFIHSCVGIVLWNLVKALGEATFSPISLYAVFPVGMLVTAIPVAPAGIGTGHYAFAKLFELMHSPAGADCYTLYAMMQLGMGALGGLVYLQFKSHEGGISLEETQKDDPSALAVSESSLRLSKT